MNIVKRFLARLFSDQMPVVRKGGPRSAPVLTILQSGKELKVFQIGSLCTLKIEHVDGRFALMRHGEKLCDFPSHEDAVAALSRIHKLVSPSRWRWVWRILIVWLAYILFVPSQTPQVGYAPPIASAAPPTLGMATAQGPVQSRLPVQSQNDEPFGLPVGSAE